MPWSRKKIGKRKKGTTRVKTDKEAEGAGNVVDLMAALQKERQVVWRQIQVEVVGKQQVGQPKEERIKTDGQRLQKKASTKAKENRAEGGRSSKAARKLPKWREPQLATLVDTAPEGGQWLSEMKYDGYRALIAIGDGTARVYTRGGKDWTDRFAQIAAAAAELPTSGTLMDGEIVAFNSNGRTDFSSLQKNRFPPEATCRASSSTFSKRTARTWPASR
ncbi:hypothetical protein QW131_29605 [Roseibium salinum]|nr:hypothetical protein [Roseibium salinum]